MDLLNTGLSWANDLQTVDSRNCGLQPQYLEIFIWSLEGFQNIFLDSACTVYLSTCLSRLKVGPGDFSWFWDDLMIRICIDHAYTVYASIFHWGLTRILYTHLFFIEDSPLMIEIPTCTPFISRVQNMIQEYLEQIRDMTEEATPGLFQWFQEGCEEWWTFSSNFCD